MVVAEAKAEVQCEDGRVREREGEGGGRENGEEFIYVF